MKFCHYFLLFFTVVFLSACSKEKGMELYKNKAYALYRDSVIQGENRAIIKSPEHIISNYKSPASANYSNRIEFKFSINEKDNELPVGVNHQIVIAPGDSISPLITFGNPGPEPSVSEAGFLAPNTPFTFQVDFTSVLQSFEEKGFYETYDGTRIAKSDFKGFFIAGSAEPLSWDFVNLDNKGLRLLPSERPGIYTIILLLNPYDPIQNETKEWKLTKDVSDKPKFESDIPLIDALYNLSLEEAKLAIEPDSTLRTGAKWGGVWTRDISYSIYLAFAYHEPAIAKNSLLRKVKRGRIIQDTGSGGAWPVSSDRTTWAMAAWELYLYTGEKEWLTTAYEVITNSLEDDARVLNAANTDLLRGESSFLDWREQSYPKWMSNKDIYLSENLGTNVVHFRAYEIAGKMAQALNLPSDYWFQKANSIKKAINDQLWNREKGFYDQFRYGRYARVNSTRFEALGESLAVIFEVADQEKAEDLIAKSPVTPFGTTCIYPQITGIPPYHNNGIWPFVQSFWNLAAAKAGNEQALAHGLAAIYRPAAFFLTNYENFVAENGDFNGTEINSHRMLWSMAGNLSMVHRVFMGMQFEEDGIRFQPIVPAAFGGMKTLKNFPYRNATIDITVKGFGNLIAAVTINNEKAEEAFIDADAEGHFTVEIILANNRFEGAENLRNNHFSPATPRVSVQKNKLSWASVHGAKKYVIYRNGKKIAAIDSTDYLIEDPDFAEYMVSAVDSSGWEGFASDPWWHLGDRPVLKYELENYARRASYPFSNFSGSGFIETDHGIHEKISCSIDVPEAGYYLFYLYYSNGSGPWNTDNKCAIRNLSVNEGDTGTLVFPQRGTNEWSDWGRSNAIEIFLKKGGNNLDIELKDWNINMDGTVNRAMLDRMELIKID
jgi:hypothetical protein